MPRQPDRYNMEALKQWDKYQNFNGEVETPIEEDAKAELIQDESIIEEAPIEEHVEEKNIFSEFIDGAKEFAGRIKKGLMFIKDAAIGVEEVTTASGTPKDARKDSRDDWVASAQNGKTGRQKGTRYRAPHKPQRYRDESEKELSK